MSGTTANGVNESVENEAIAAAAAMLKFISESLFSWHCWFCGGGGGVFKIYFLTSVKMLETGFLLFDFFFSALLEVLESAEKKIY